MGGACGAYGGGERGAQGSGAYALTFPGVRLASFTPGKLMKFN